MSGLVTIQGKVIGTNSIRYEGRIISCWTIPMQAAVAPQPLDLSQYIGKVVELSGRLHGDLWEATFLRVVDEAGYR